MARLTEPDEIRMAAGLIRLLIGVLAVTALAAIYPGIAQVRWVYGLYLITAIVFEVLIILRIGDRPRAILGGFVDMAMLTFTLHRVGSATSFLVSIYIFTGMINALVVSRRVGTLLSGFASLMYGAVLAAESLGLLPYARTLAGEPMPPPTAGEAFVVWGIVSALLYSTSAITGALVDANRQRERELRAANARLADLSERDPLTDLWNRRHLLSELGAAIATGSTRELGLAVFDLDRFKAVNDRLGHVQGDALLRSLARALSVNASARDEVCRFGGDEFVVLLRGGNDEIAARAQLLVDAVRAASREFHAECVVTASVGLAIVRRGETSEDLIRRADELAYEAKRRGGDRVVSDSVAG